MSVLRFDLPPEVRYTIAKKEERKVVTLIEQVTVKWEVRRPMFRGSQVGTYSTREEAQDVADAQTEPHVVNKWEIHEYKNSTGCGWCDEEANKGFRAPKGSALCAEHNRIRLETL